MTEIEYKECINENGYEWINENDFEIMNENGK